MRACEVVFTLLAQAHHIDADLADGLRQMIGFRNIVLHDYMALQLPIMVAIIEQNLEGVLKFAGEAGVKSQ
ncbi:MAG TPA: DUF86 domain-containing protein [Rhodocyclaceae bacterium]|nr:DUF86 domain-containing protein [Rhodocyclaceae bacterium]